MSLDAVRPERKRTRLRAAPGALPLGAILGSVGLLAAAGVRLLHLDRLGFTVCAFKAVTGWPCLTCGGTRTLARLARLDLAGAFAMNPLVALAALLLAPWAVADAVLLTRGGAVALDLGAVAARRLRIVALLALVANWAYVIAMGR